MRSLTNFKGPDNIKIIPKSLELKSVIYVKSRPIMVEQFMMIALSSVKSWPF